MRLAAATTLLLALCAGLAAPAQAQQTVVVPTRVIYPGETLGPEALEEVLFTNRPSLLAGVAVGQREIEGQVALRTLLPGRMIPKGSTREPYAVEAGKPVEVRFAAGALVISVTGVPLQHGSIGDTVRVRNVDSGIVITGTVLADGTIRVGST